MTQPAPISGDVSKVIEAFPDADLIKLIDDDLFVVVDYNFSKNSTDIQIYDASKDSIVNDFSVAEVSYSIVPKIIDGQGFGVAFDYTKYSGNDNGVIGFYYSIKDNEVTKFETTFDKEWNYWDSCAFAPDGSAMYILLDDRSICACGYNFNPDFKTRLIEVNADGSGDNTIVEYDHHTSLQLTGTTDDGRLVVTYTEDPNDYPHRTHEEFEMMSLQALNSDTEPGKIEHGLAFIDPGNFTDPDQTSVIKEAAMDKITVLPDGCRQMVYRQGSFICFTDDKIIKLAPDSNGVINEAVYDCNIPDNVEYFSYEDKYVSSNGDYVVFSARYKDKTGSMLYIIHFDNDDVKTVLEEANDSKMIDLTDYYGPVIFDEEDGVFYARYDDTSTDNMERNPYQINIDK
ncbi:MAG: hypothetical protein K6C99_02580 [Lachnospiraceae bacterium]|nr:hypothetical protein [Lachnospiraceae bacterium]